MKISSPNDDDAISEGHMADDPAQQLLPLVDDAFDGILVIDLDELRVKYANRAAEHFAGQRPESLTGRLLSDFVTFDSPLEFASLMRSLAADQSHGLHGKRFETSLRTTGEHPSRFDARLCRLLFNGQLAAGVILRPCNHGIENSPINSRPSATRRDPLTGLADRSFALARLEELLSMQPVADSQFALLFIDLDNFKHVNDSCGHLVGDRVLKEVAERLARCVRGRDQVARYGGDEFVVLLQGLRRDDGVKAVIERIHAALSVPIQLPDGETRLAASIGVAQPSETLRTAEELLAEADRAMYAAKRQRS